MTKWDYRIIGITGPETQSGVAEMMARHGAEGWELVTIDFDRGWAYFKRPSKPEMPSLLVVNNIPGYEFEHLIDNIKAELELWWEEATP